MPIPFFGTGEEENNAGNGDDSSVGTITLSPLFPSIFLRSFTSSFLLSHSSLPSFL
jgi:hypothetical protein